MDATTIKIVKMLEDERMERRCAAAMVLGELRVKDAAAMEALARCLQEDSTVLQRYALEALAGARSAKIAPFVLPLLDHGDDEIRAQAAALLANQGARAAAALARELHGAPLTRRRAIVSILVRNHDSKNFERLLRLLPDAEIGDYVRIALRGEVEHMSAREQELLRDKVAELLKEREWLTDNVAVARSLRVLGTMRNARLARTILPFATEKKPVPVRMAAIAALRRPLAAAKKTDEALRTLLRHADDPDATLARCAVDTLRELELPDDLTDELIRLSEGRHAEARKFALEALGPAGGKKVVQSMLSHLRGDDPAARDASARALARMEGVSGPLLRELQRAGDDVRLTRRLCGLLRKHRDELKPAGRKAIAELAIGAMEQGSEAAEPLLELLHAVEPERYRELLLARARTHRRAGRHREAFELLCRMEDADLLDEDGRYMATVCGLCSLSSKKELGRASRTTDPVLRQAVELVGSGYPLATKLRKEKNLSPEDLFFVGFNFAESKDEDEKEFGGLLLSHLVKKSPRSKLGRSARNKLKLVGLE